MERVYIMFLIKRQFFWIEKIIIKKTKKIFFKTLANKYNKCFNNYKELTEEKNV